MQTLRSYAKYILKMKIVAPLRSLFLTIGGARTNREGWENRLLIINLQALGDVTLFTSVLKHYKERFPDKKIYLLTKGVGLESFFKGAYVDEVITLEYSRFAVNPCYGAGVINRLRRIGFHTVIDQDFSAAEIMGKIVAVSLDAARVIGYEGNGGEFMQPYDAQQARNLRIITNRLYPRFTKIVPSFDVLRGTAKEAPSVLHHYRTMFEAVVADSGVGGFAAASHTDRAPDYYSMEFPARILEGADATLAKFGLHAKNYGIVNVNASTPFKRWPLERFLEVAKALHAHGLSIVLVGSRGEQPLVARFEAMLRESGIGDHVTNVAGRTGVQELIQIVAHARVTITNDTSLVHIAVATKAPLIGVLGGAWFGMFNDFGHADIHRWVFRERFCYGDNWACTRGIGDAPAPCLLGVEASAVTSELEDLLRYLDSHAQIPAKPWREGFLPEMPGWGVNTDGVARRDGDASGKLKILYAGLRCENYDRERYPSFEYANFFGTLASMPGVSAMEFPFDSIVGMGRRWWNRRLLEAVRREKPDLVFVFMLSDEFEPETLDGIKKLTKTVAWFADDQWRLDNYSRWWAPHFTRGVTTWSRAPALYDRYGVTNVIRSQWAANPTQWKPTGHGSEPSIPVSFIGQRTSARAGIVAGLEARGIHVTARGTGWPDGRVGVDEALRLIAASKINLNLNTPLSRFNPRAIGRIFVRRSLNRLIPDFHWINNLKCWWRTATPQAKARPFEILACDAFLISPDADDTDRYYENTKEIVYYDGTIADLANKIKYYLEPGDERTEERRKIAHAGYERTLREHTYEKRFREIFKELGL